MTKLHMTYGALAIPLRRQLRGLGISREAIAHFQRDSDAVTRLAVRGLVSEAEARRIRQRLTKMIAGQVMR